MFGGSFDPVHCGHMELARAARRECGLDRVFFIPALRPPHKKGRVLTDARRRLAMLRLAIKPYPAFAISTFELKRETTTYTYQTLEYFRARYPSAKLFFILGSDSLSELASWKRAQTLGSLCTFIAGTRAGAPRAAAMTGMNMKIHFLKTHVMRVSSSDIRRKISLGEKTGGLMPQPVQHYIITHGLYKTSTLSD